MLANTLKQANLQIQQHHGEQKRYQRFLKEWSELQESVLAVECVQMYGVIYMYVCDVHRMFIVNVQEERKGRKDKRGRRKGERERERGEQGERLKGNMNSQFHTFTHVHVIRTIM